MSFSQLNFPKVLFSQVIVSSSLTLNTTFPSYMTSYKLHFVGYTFQDYTLLMKNVTVELNTKHCHHD